MPNPSELERVEQEQKPEPPYYVFVHGADFKELLRINPDGSVVAPDLESASEAGRVFVESVRDGVKAMFDGR